MRKNMACFIAYPTPYTAVALAIRIVVKQLYKHYGL